MWGRELHPAYGKAASVVERLGAEAEEVETKEKLQMIVQAIRKAMREVWNPDVSLFEIRSVNFLWDAADSQWTNTSRGGGQTFPCRFSLGSVAECV